MSTAASLRAKNIREFYGDDPKEKSTRVDPKLAYPPYTRLEKALKRFA